MLPFHHQLPYTIIDYHQLSFILNLFKFFMIVGPCASWQSMIVYDSSTIMHHLIGALWKHKIIDIPDHLGWSGINRENWSVSIYPMSPSFLRSFPTYEKINWKNLGRSGNSEIPELLGFSQHTCMKTSLKELHHRQYMLKIWPSFSSLLFSILPNLNHPYSFLVYC